METHRGRVSLEVFVAVLVAAAIVAGFYVVGEAFADERAAAPSVPDAPATADASAAPVESTAPADDHHGAAIDDRGFSLLENGEQHHEDFTQPLDPATRETLAAQLTLAREVALQYPTVADAEAAGLRRAGPFSPGLGAHYLNFGAAVQSFTGQARIEGDEWIRNPIAWIYDGTDPDSKVAGLFYSASGDTPPEGFAGPNDVWHKHTNICIVNTPTGIDTPLGADHDVDPADCRAVGGSLVPQTGYLLHVWPVPGYESPEGVFSHLSSAVTCPDGTYYTIDRTKIGNRTTVCRGASGAS